MLYKRNKREKYYTKKLDSLLESVEMDEQDYDEQVKKEKRREVEEGMGSSMGGAARRMVDRDLNKSFGDKNKRPSGVDLSDDAKEASRKPSFQEKAVSMNQKRRNVVEAEYRSPTVTPEMQDEFESLLSSILDSGVEEGILTPRQVEELKASEAAREALGSNAKTDVAEENDSEGEEECEEK